MKKRVSFLMALVMLVTLLGGCGSDPQSGDSDVRTVNLRNTASLTTSDPNMTTQKCN